jgi:hypothetical protein
MVSKIGHIELEAFVQATEDEAKVVRALSNLTGKDVSSSVEVTRTEGFHKNPLIILKVKFAKDREIRDVLSALLRSDRFSEALIAGGEERLDEENVLHFRFDKQAAYDGTAEPHMKGESVKFTMKVLTFPFSREAAIDHLKGLAISGAA